jgi:uncharacterized protein (TIGR02145 family)
LGSYGSTILPLSPATTYYVRAYATNANGTSYGDEISFVTATANNNGNMPTISTNQVVYMDSLSAFCGGNITADGGLAVTARGVCWAIGTTPTINNTRTIDGSGAGSFNSRLPDLLPKTSYFVRAYATNDAGTSYGVTFSFTTKGFATVETDSVFDVLALSASAAGRVLSDGGVSVIERGFCWSYAENPNIEDNKVEVGVGLGAFSQKIVSLLPDTLVYVRAFVGSSIGFTYGSQLSFRTQTGLPVVVTDSVTTVSSFGAHVSAAVINVFGSEIIERGICWSENPNPTKDIGNLTLDLNPSVGSFIGKMYGLKKGTIYYVRAFARSEVAVVYGNELSFLTDTPNYNIGTVHCSASPTTIVEIINPISGRTWMDRNLGASQVANSSNDTASKGDLFQWGRAADGHQCRSSQTTNVISFSDQVGHGDFIIEFNNWLWTQNSNLWDGVNGMNNPCPEGYRLPTASEFDQERLTWSSNDEIGAFLSPLKLPLTGYRGLGTGDFLNDNTHGYYWSSTANCNDSRNLGFRSGSAGISSNNRAQGFSVRCIKEIQRPPVGILGSLNCSEVKTSGMLVPGVPSKVEVPYSGGNGGSYDAQQVSSFGVTGLMATLTQGDFANGPGSLIYTISGSPIGSGMVSFILNIGLQKCTLTFALNEVGVPSYPSGTVHCSSNQTSILEVTNPITGRTWMDRNLGATKAASSITDTAAYGDLYQWGRAADGHQCKNAATRGTLSGVDKPLHGDFITTGFASSDYPYNWRSPENLNLWQGVNGINNPCPSGYRLPTITELNTERLSWRCNNSEGALSSTLKLPLAGARVWGNGTHAQSGTNGYYWSSTINLVFSQSLNIQGGNAEIGTVSYRSSGLSVRCIKD